jgi:hypothetical protein
LLLRPAFSLKGKEDIMGRITDNRADIYQEITDQMIAMIEAGTRPWSKSWNGSTAPNIPLRSTGVPYRGINVLTLWVAVHDQGLCLSALADLQASACAWWMRPQGREGFDRRLCQQDRG